jgi:hypothetical protein
MMLQLRRLLEAGAFVESTDGQEHDEESEDGAEM